MEKKRGGTGEGEVEDGGKWKQNCHPQPPRTPRGLHGSPGSPAGLRLSPWGTGSGAGVNRGRSWGESSKFSIRDSIGPPRNVRVTQTLGIPGASVVVDADDNDRHASVRPTVGLFEKEKVAGLGQTASTSRLSSSCEPDPTVYEPAKLKRQRRTTEPEN